MINNLRFEKLGDSIFAERVIRDKYTMEQAKKLYEDTMEYLAGMKDFVENLEMYIADEIEKQKEDGKDEDFINRMVMGMRNQAKMFEERNIPDLESEEVAYNQLRELINF